MKIRKKINKITAIKIVILVMFIITVMASVVNTNASSVRKLSPLKVVGGYIIPRVSIWKVGTSTTVYYGDGSHLTGVSGSSLWTDAESFTYLTATSSDVIIGGNTTSSAPFWVDVSTGNLTITGNLISADSFLTGVDWGDITGTLSNQTDLQNVLDEKLSTTTAASTYVKRNNWATIDDYPTGCSVGEFVREIGDTLTCATDQNTTYSAGGTLLNLTGTTFSVNEGTLTDGLGCKYVSGTGLVCDQNYLTTVSASDVDVLQLGSPTYTNVQDWLNTTQSAGKLTGGDITDNGDGTVKVTAGTGFIKTTDSDVADTKFFDWSVNNSLSLTDNATNYIYVEYNSGSPQIVASTSTPSDKNTNVLLGLVYRDGTDLYITTAGQVISNYAKNTLWKDLEVNGKFQRVDGIMISETGTRNIAITSGSVYAGLTRVTFPAFDSSGTDTFTYYYRDGGTGWTKVTGQSQIDNLHYDDGSGTLAELSNQSGWRKYYGVHWVYADPDGHVFVVYGQGNYLLSDAENAQPPSTLPDIITSIGGLVGKIIIEKNASSFENIESAFDVFFVPHTVVNHNELSGLQGGTTDEYYHLNANEWNNLSGINQALKTTDSPSFKSLSIGINIETLSGDKTLTPGTDEMYQYLDPNGSDRVITLNTSNAEAGDRFVIRHNGDYDSYGRLEIKQGSDTLDYIYAGAIKKFIFDGTNWIAFDNGTGEKGNKDYNVAIGGHSIGYEEGTAIGYLAFGAYYGVGVGNGAWGDMYGTAVGYHATGRRYGVAVGYEAGYNISFDDVDRYNTLIGAYSGYQVTTGKGNIILGYKSGYDSTYSPTTGSYNILIGHQSWTPANNTSNFLNIGGLIFGTNLATAPNTISTGKVGIGTINPTATLDVNGDIAATGLTVDGGVRLDTSDTKPTCDTTTRGMLWFTKGDSGVKDTLEVCAKDASDTYSWRTIY